jgi:hypothetical protein
MEREKEQRINRRELFQFLKKHVLQDTSDVLVIAGGLGIGGSIGQLLTGTKDYRAKDASKDIGIATGLVVAAKALDSLAK